MDWEYLHLVTQPFCVVFGVAGVGVGLVGWIVGNDRLELYAVVSFLLAGIMVLPAFITGLAAADVELERTFIRPSAVRTHRIWSTWATVALVMSATFAAFSLLQASDRRLRRFVIAVAVLTTATAVVAAYTGLQIRHGIPATAPASNGAVVRLASLGPASAIPFADTLDARAREIHERAIVVDGHNDLPWRIRRQTNLDIESYGLGQRRTDGHTDLVRLREGGVDVQFWAAYVPTGFIGAEATVVALEQMDLIKRITAAFPADLEMAYTLEDIERIVGQGRIASMIGIEGGHAIANSLPVLRELYAAGARYMTLTHSATLAWADAAGDTVVHDGLTPFGREVVREMNRLGMLVDLSHVTPAVMSDALETSRAPVIFSHSSARAIADHPRNVPDEILRRLPANGGVVMVNFFSGFVVPESAERIREIFAVQERLRAESPDEQTYQAAFTQWLFENIEPGDVSIVADHIDRIVEVAGIDHVGLGSDFDGISIAPRRLDDVATFPNLTSELLARGYTEEELLKFLGGNLLRVLGEAELTAIELSASSRPAATRLPFRGLEPARAAPR